MLEPLRGLRAERRRAIETNKLIGDGGYSRVIAMNAYSVLKLTSCRQTQQLLDALAKLNRADHPSGLPVVLERWGTVAKDADGIEFKGYVLERLFSENATAERLRGKRLGLPVIAQRRALPSSDFQMRLKELFALREQLEDARERCILGERTAHAEHLQMADQLAVLRMPAGLESTFAYLAQFLRQTKGELDLFQGGNILLDCTGRPMLADPVAEMTTDDGGLPDKLHPPGFALVARSVVALNGLQAAVEWDTVSLSDDEGALQEAGDQLLQTPGRTIEARVLPHGGDVHRKLIAQGRTSVDIWQIPPATRRFALRGR